MHYITKPISPTLDLVSSRRPAGDRLSLASDLAEKILSRLKLFRCYCYLPQVVAHPSSALHGHCNRAKLLLGAFVLYGFFMGGAKILIGVVVTTVVVPIVGENARLW